MSGPATIHPWAQGSLCLLPASTRILLPASASSLTNTIVASKSMSLGGIEAVAAAASTSHSSDVAPSRLPGTPNGHAAWWTGCPVKLR